MNNSIIAGSTSFGNGGAIYNDHKSCELTIENSIINNVASTQDSGGFLYISSGVGFYIKNCTLKDASALEGKIMVFTTPVQTEMLIENSNFTCSTTQQFILNDLVAAFDQPCSSNASALYVSNAHSFNMSENIFENCIYACYGGVIRLDHSNFSDSYSLF